jgi:two-component system, OmpR family, response regulator
MSPNAPHEPLCRVLHVDDDEDVLVIARHALRRACGIEVRSMTDAAEAVQSLQTWRPQLILADCNMPGMDGRALLAAVRQAAIAIPVVLVTQTVLPRFEQQLLALGAHAVLRKPMELRDWGEDVQAVWLAIHRAARERDDAVHRESA